jgi:hypothetical protein
MAFDVVESTKRILARLESQPPKDPAACPRGIPIIITRHHFFHLTKLKKGLQTDFTVEVEE